MIGIKVSGAIRSLVNAMGLQLECTRKLHEAFLMLVLLLLRSNPSRQHSDTISLGCQKKRKDRKSWKGRSEEKVVSFSSSPIPRKEMGARHPGWNQGDRSLDAEENPGSRYRQSFG